jgi:hypothetical protein
MYPGGKEAKEFFERCTARGVPKDFIFDWAKNFRVTAYRSIGLGSLGVKYDITNQLLQVSGSFDEVGKRAALRDWVSVRVGYKNADKYVASLDRDQVSSNETSIAMLEFNDVAEGSQVVVGGDQLHKIHIDVFVERMAPIMQAAQQGQMQDPITMYRTMQLAMQHIQQHLQILAQDMRYKQYVKSVVGFLQDAARITGMIEQEAKRMMKAQQAQAQAQQDTVNNAQKVLQDRELEAKIYEITKKYEAKAMEQESLNHMRDVKTQEQARINNAKAEADIRRKAEKQAVELQLAAGKAQADIALKQSSAG